MIDADITIDRTCNLSGQIIFLDGISGTGKTMLAPILASHTRVEVQRLEHIYEYICALHYLGHITRNAAETIIKLHLDIACYNVMIGREVNFRWKDLSGVLSNPNGWRYIRRLLQPDGESVVARINSERPIVQIVSHQVLGISEPILSSLGTRLTVIESVRHPLHLIRHWCSYIDRFGQDPRDFTIWTKRESKNTPWFATGWESQYLSANQMDKVIYSINHLTHLANQVIASQVKTSSSNILIIPFELFVTNPYSYLDQIADTLEIKPTPKTRTTLRKQRIPRDISTAGKDLPIYRRYQWRPPQKNMTEHDILGQEWMHASRYGSADALRILAELCVEYDNVHLHRNSSVADYLNLSQKT